MGLTREIKEETGLNINVLTPLNIRHFKRKDGQIITMIIFLCTLKEDSSVKLSEEHVGHEWIDIANCEDKLTDFFHKEARIFKNIYSNSKNWLSSIS